MASHKKHAQPTTFALPGKSQMVKIVATVAAVGLLATGGIVSHNLYATAEKSPAKQVTAYSVTDSIEASRGNAREALSGDTSYVTVKINGKTRVVPGMHFTDVKSVLDAGDITLDTEDTVSPPYAPAFINTAPPMLPGMPCANSMPVKDASSAAFATFELSAPAPATISLPLTYTLSSFDVFMTAPRIPSSSTSRFEPFPTVI